MKKIAISLLAVIFSANVNSQEVATFQAICDTTARVFSLLEKEYGEKPMVMGMGGEDHPGVMTLWANASKKTWTIVFTQSDRSCVMAVGDSVSFKHSVSSEKKTPI